MEEARTARAQASSFLGNGKYSSQTGKGSSVFELLAECAGNRFWGYVSEVGRGLIREAGFQP